MYKITAAIAILALGAVASPTAAHAGKTRPVPAVTCQAQVVVGSDLSVFGSPAAAGRNRLGELIAPSSGRISLSMVAGVFIDGTPDASRAVYKVVPSAGLRYMDQWFSEERPLEGTAWISGTAIRPSAKFLACEGRLPVYGSETQT